MHKFVYKHQRTNFNIKPRFFFKFSFERIGSSFFKIDSSSWRTPKGIGVADSTVIKHQNFIVFDAYTAYSYAKSIAIEAFYFFSRLFQSYSQVVCLKGRQQ